MHLGTWQICGRVIPKFWGGDPLRADGVRDDKVKALIVANSPCTAEEVVEYCLRRIAYFKMSSLIEFSHILPKSPTGKVRERMLRDSRNEGE